MTSKLLSLIGGFFLVLLFLVLLMAFWPMSHPQWFDLARLFVRPALNAPLMTRTQSLPASPSGTWRIEMVGKIWTYYDSGDMGSYRLRAWKNGAPFLRGRDLSGFNESKMLSSRNVEWLTDSIFRASPARLSSASTISVTVFNDSPSTVPVGSLSHTNPGFWEYIYLLEIPPGATVKTMCAIPTTGDWFGFTTRGDRELRVSHQYAGRGGGFAKGLKVTMFGNRSPRIEILTVAGHP